MDDKPTRLQPPANREKNFQIFRPPGPRGPNFFQKKFARKSVISGSRPFGSRPYAQAETRYPNSIDERPSRTARDIANKDWANRPDAIGASPGAGIFANSGPFSLKENGCARTVSGMPKLTMDLCSGPAYNPLHDVHSRHHYSNYMPGALTRSSRRDKAFEASRRPHPDIRHHVTKDAADVRRNA